MWLGVAWFVIVLGGLASIGIGFFVSTPVGIAAIVASLMLFAVFGSLTDYYLGLRRRFARHLGSNWHEGELLSHPVPRHSRADTQLALNALRDLDPDAKVYGRSAMYLDTDDTHAFDTQTMIEHIQGNPRPQTLKYIRLPRSKDETLKVAENSIHLLALRDGTRFAVMWVTGQIEVLANTAEQAQRALDHLLDLARKSSVYRGEVVSLRRSETEGDTGYDVEFHDLPVVARDEIVLPPDLTAAIDRNVPGWLAKADALRAAGQSTRHGVLLHGPPGTGKSMVVKYLAGSARGVTVILLAGRQLSLVRESCRLARLLAPSLIVLEDVDLIATDREQSRDTALLHDLMDEMDGLGPRAEVIFLLTTNRPEVIEKALANRPGRVDQAIFFPLPDRDCRRRLFDVFGRKLDLSAVDRDRLLDRTDGASPAFLAELFRKAVVFAAERGEASRPLKLTDADFAAAVRELVEFGGELTRNLLGYRAQ